MLTHVLPQRRPARRRARHALPHAAVACTVLLCAALGAGPATGQSQVTFVPSVEIAGCSDTLFVDLVVDELMTDLHGYSFVIGFDPTVLDPVAVEPGALLVDAGDAYFFQWLNPGPDEATIAVDASVFGGAIDGPGSIIVMAFVGVTTGDSPLFEISGTMRDGQNQDIPYSLPDGQASYMCAGLTFEPPDGVIDCGESITVDLVVDEGVAALVSFSLEVVYDPSIIQPIDAALGNLLADAPCASTFNWLVPDPMAGVLLLQGELDGCDVTGPGVIAQVTFGGEADGDSALDCPPGGLLLDALGNEIPFVCVPASVTNLCPIAAERTSWQRVKALYR